jgi:glycosyltransferase involved in cell wall biosynthesis
LDDFFNFLDFLYENRTQVPDNYFEFPGPFIRKIINYLDQTALSKTGIIKFCATSNTVGRRVEYFPPGADVVVVNHPSFLKNYRFGNYEYIFMISRLDPSKRIDMLIQAMQFVKYDVKLYIAGTGPQEKELKNIAKHDKRIIFLGFITDEEAERYYSNCLIVPYFPYDEDYGLITIEAMLHKKPVITTMDSGGPTEFVMDNETGFSTAFDPQAIAEKIEYFVVHKDEAKRMGENAYNLVKKITWENTISELIGSESIKSNIKPLARKKITVTSTFPIFPPQGGGQSRIFNLFKTLSNEFDIELISLTNADQPAYNDYIAQNLREIRIPKTQDHQDEEWKIEKEAGIVVSDIGAITLTSLTPEYEKVLKRSMDTANIIIMDHPYLLPSVKKYLNNKIVIYDAQNAESIMKESMIPSSNRKQKLINSVFEVEKECCDICNCVFTCSKEDQDTFNKIYKTPYNKMLLVPNGVNCGDISFIDMKQRTRNKQELGIPDETLGLFMGSWHQPNLESCEIIFEIAKKCPHIKFLFMGSQCLYFKSRKLPENVGLLGVVSESTKKLILSVVDFALNPTLSGSGTNLKMFDYMAAGIPIITTEFGTRGISNKEGFIISEPAEMTNTISNFSLLNYERNIYANRRYAEESFDWKVIAEPVIKMIYTLIGESV